MLLLLRYCVAKRVRSKKRQALLKFLRQFQAGNDTFQNCLSHYHNLMSKELEAAGKIQPITERLGG